MGGSEGSAQTPKPSTGESTKSIRAWMSWAVRRLTNWWSRRSENAQHILAGYAIVLLFFIVFFVLAALGSDRRSKILDQTSVLLLLSLVAVLPPLVEFLRQVVSTVKVGDILEFSFREITDRTKAQIEKLQVGMAVEENLMYMAKDNWKDILRELDRFNESNAEVVRVDLGTASKRTWKFPNLYFFALLLQLRSGVRHLLFLQKRDDGRDEFITMCAPGDLRQDLEKLFPPFRVAASKWREAQAGSTPAHPGPNIEFDHALDEALGETSRELFALGKSSDARVPQPGYHGDWVEPEGLRRVLGLHINICRIQWKERLTRDDYRAILACCDRYVAVIQDGSLVNVLDQERAALAVAREVT